MSNKLTINLLLECAECNGPLDFHVSSENNSFYIEVEPCKKCLEEARKEHKPA